MRLLVYLTLIVVTILAMVALNQIALVQDVITATGFSSSEVIAGITGVLVIFYTLIFALTYRGS